MSSKFEFTFDERAFKKAVEKTANEAVKSAAADAQRVVDSLHRSHSGKPVNDVLRKLKSDTRRAGWKATDKELRGYAEAISNGTRVEVRAEKL